MADEGIPADLGAALRAMTREEIAAAYGDGLRQMTPDEFAEWQKCRARARALGVTLPSDQSAFSPFGSLFGLPF
jgi:hypothetical protein